VQKLGADINVKFSWLRLAVLLPIPTLAIGCGFKCGETLKVQPAVATANRGV